MRPSAAAVALAGGLYALALWLRLQVLPAAPYGADEGLHYWISRHLAAVPDNVSDVDGLTWFHPSWLVWQRPAYYVAMHPFALHGFEAFRAGHAMLSSLLPMVAFGLLRAFGATRVAATGAGLFAAAYPPFVAWGGLGLMDEPMTVAFGAAVWALRSRRALLAGTLFVLAAWTKETAVLALLVVLAGTLLAGWVAGRNRLDPFELDRPSAALLLAAPLSLLPLQVALSSGLDTIGAAAPWNGALPAAVWVTPWLLPVLLLGLRFRASRPLCALALALGLLFLLLNGVLHRAVEAWYLVPPAFFAACAAIAALDAATRGMRRRALPALASVAVAGLLAWTIVGPAGLEERIRYETTIRDRDFLEAVAAAQPGPSRTVITVDVPNLYPFAERARHVYVDSAAARSVLLSYGDGRFHAAAAVEGTVIVASKSGYPFTATLEEAYGDCRVLDNERFRVYESWRCAGPGENVTAPDSRT
jgi:hypothetical protein